MLGTPGLNKVYEDETCTVYLHDVYGNGDLMVVHVDVIKTVSRQVLDHYRDVIESLFEALRARGREEVEAWVSTDKEIRFAQFFGFDEFLGQLMINGRETLPEVYRLKRKL